MKSKILLNKREGETPLECLERFRKTHKSYKDMPMTYAGRLDPMASGTLLILIGEECKKKEKYLKLDKEYEFEVLFGFSSDSYDILGKINHSLIRVNGRIINKSDLEKSIAKNLKFFKGKFIQKYPIYSSRTVKGKHLFEYAKTGEEVEIPEKEIEVKSLKFIKLRRISAQKLLSDVERRIKIVKGDFRQQEILKIWQEYLKNKEEIFYVAKFKIKCSSGTYVRSIANSLGDYMNIPALAWSIKRTKIYSSRTK